ncbi:GFA family protein, partial [Streptomyces lunaelactis]|uniref:GFA family protein n=1 Tax=Streptomyces lunaelactis TaxID=1535768 RepID=UPI001C311187
MTIELPSRPLITIACHCVDCQKRTGAPFGVLAYYRVDHVSIVGEAKAYERVSAVGNKVETFFCPVCGSTVYLKLAKQSALRGVALGSIADPPFSAPSWSVWEQSKSHWIHISVEVQRFP